MRAAKAIEALRAFCLALQSPELKAGGPEFTAWQAKVRAVFAASLGHEDHLIQRLDRVRYRLSVASENTQRYEFDAARHRGIRDACGVIDAGIYQLSLLTGAEEPIDEMSFDPELWSHMVARRQSRRR